MMVDAVAQNQTDARCYLATLLTRKARIIVEDEEKQLRIVGEEYDLFKRDYGQMAKWSEDMADAEEPIFQVTFWDNTHGITIGNVVRLEAPSNTSPRVIDILEGTVTEVKDHEIFVRGMEHVGTES